DADRLEQALTNMVANALAHGDGPVTLTARERNGHVELHVLDEGPGFAREFLPVAFERFSPADPARSRGGAGLGLALVPVPAGVRTGMAARIRSDHRDDPSQKPIPVRRQVITFPEGTTWGPPVVPDCTASDLELQLVGQSACPPDSWIGAGHGNTYMTGFRGD